MLYVNPSEPALFWKNLTSRKRHTDKVYYLDQRPDDGVRDVLSDVVDDHVAALRRFVRIRLNDHPDYEDLVQETFLRLAHQDHLEQRLSRGRSSTRSYLFSIASNLINDRYRKAKVRKLYMEREASDGERENSSISAADHAELRENIEQIGRAVEGLNPTTRRAFLLSRIEALSYREIAGELGVSVSMVEKHIIRALAEIRNTMDR
ncbi:MAG: RNA polymerase sigma factor [Pseudomonadota bacterium]